MEKLEANRELWPKALRQAEDQSQEKIGGAADGFLWIEKRDYESYRTGAVNARYMVLWQANREAPRYNLGPVAITDEEFTDYKKWFDMKIAEKRATDRKKFTEKLLADGVYERKSPGLLMAVKINEILRAISRPISMRELIDLDADIYTEDAKTSSSLRELARYPILSDDGGEVKLSARHAMAKLHSAGLVEHHGARKNRRYSVID